MELKFKILLLKYLVIAYIPSVRCKHTQDKGVQVSTEVSIVQQKFCSEIPNLCPRTINNEDITILECIYALEPKLVSSIDKQCQNILWSRTASLIENHNLMATLSEVCTNLNKVECQSNGAPGSYLKCLVDNKDKLESLPCVDLIERYENIGFHDSQWIISFSSSCKQDISDLGCGRVDKRNLLQSETFACLQDKVDRASPSCQREIFKLSEDSFDGRLYLACKNEYDKYCGPFEASTSKIFACLMQHRNEIFTNACHDQLLRREKLISQDYKVSKGIMRACKEDIKNNRCRRLTSDDKTIRLAQILLCLESAVRNNTKIKADCKIEMIDHRKMLMEDYSLTPEIVEGCIEEIHKWCSGLGGGGKTIHCLMERARIKYKEKIGDKCQRSLEYLVQETDVGEDWRVDPVLHAACNPVVLIACKDIRGGNARVVSCLMDKIGEDFMTEECEEALMQIQYFVARDFKLDPQLYQACHEDATRLCHSPKNWYDAQNYDPNLSPLIFPCLYRYVYVVEKDKQLKGACIKQIRLVMQQRAISVDLEPQIEEICLSDLAEFCFEKTAKGEEMECLQKNLEELEDNCKESVSKFTEIEAQYVGLNPYIMKYCKKAMETHCGDEMNNDKDGIMDCLIAHKNDPDVKSNSKCRVSVEHFQIISLKDYRFTYKFKIACKNYATRYCRGSKSKASIVACLSEKVRNDTINGLKSDIPKECRQQIKAQLFRQRENIDLDPKLNKICLSDIKLHCGHVEHGGAQVLECLQSTSAKLSTNCRKEIFKVKTQETADNSLDYALITMCADSIQQFCSRIKQEHVLQCLQKNKNEVGFDKKCKLVVTHRLIEQQSDYRLNPLLRDNCQVDIDKFCKGKLVGAKADQELNGQVINCLKGVFKQSRLSNNCEKQMAIILRERALDIRLNPSLIAKCSKELDMCREGDEDDDFGDTEECLKNALIQSKIKSPECRLEVANLIDESQVDIEVDPLLQRVCALDLLKFCGNIPRGKGRHIKCLKIILEDSTKKLETECRDMLGKRLEMYSNSARIVSPEDFQELYDQVITSPAKHYFLMVVMLTLALFFLIGIFCGRVSKRHVVTNKNK